MFNQIITSLCDDKTILRVGYLGGICWFFIENKTNFMENSLSSLLGASITGLFMSFGASFVAGTFPDNFKFIVPVSVCASLLYSAAKFLK